MGSASGLTHAHPAPRSDRARWITALTHRERQARGPPNKGGESLPCTQQGSQPLPCPGAGVSLEPRGAVQPSAHPAASPRVTCPGGALPQVRVCPSGHTDPALAQDLVLPAAK